jgi:dTDP-4-dehydrorhamnose reductase
MSAILVTGAGGLLGSVLVPYLRAQGHRVTGCSRRQGEKHADLTDYHQVKTAFNELHPGIIINLAANTNIDECERRPQFAYLANVRIVENLVKWIRSESPTSHLIQVSTDHLYGGVGPHREDDITLVNYYGFSKYAGELAALAVPATILRTNFFGRSRCAERASLSDWLVQSLTHGRAITVFDDVYFSPLSMSRLVAIIEVVLSKRVPGIFNLGTSDGMSKADFSFQLAEILGLPTTTMTRGPYTAAPLNAPRATDMRMDSSRFQSTYGLTLPRLKAELLNLRTDYVSAP